MNPQLLNAVRMQFAQFLQKPIRRADDGPVGLAIRPHGDRRHEEDESGTYALHTLKENETIARLATGIKRFELPDEFNYIKIFQQIAAEPQTGPCGRSVGAVGPDFREPAAIPQGGRLLAGVAQAISQRGRQSSPGLAAAARPDRRQLGPIRAAQTQPAGRGATIDYRFRNGDAGRVHGPRNRRRRSSLDDVKAFLKSQSQAARLAEDQHRQHRLSARRRRISSNTSAGRSPSGSCRLSRGENHFDKRVTVTTPLQKPGAYLVTAKMAGGNTSSIVVWIDDTAIVKKPLAGKTYYFVADAVTGKPIAKANVEFFGWQQLYHDNPPRHEVITKQFAEFTDADGQVIPDPQQQSQNYPVARHRADRRRPFRLSRLHRRVVRPAVRRRVQRHEGLHDHRPARLPARAEGEVQVLDSPRQVRHGGRVRLRQPGSSRSKSTIRRARRSSRRRKKTDAFGGIEGEYAIPADATLGVYASSSTIRRNHGGGSFRVEEYKKPEFEVTVDAPDRAGHARRENHRHDQGEILLRLAGDQGQSEVQDQPHQLRRALVSASGRGTGSMGRAIGGSPTITTGIPAGGIGAARGRCRSGGRTSSSRPNWSPIRKWTSGPDGTVKVEIDTAVAKAIHPDQDHSYTITAEVVDAVAAHDRRHGHGAGRPQAVHGLCLGRSRLLPRRRHDPRPFLRPHARRQAGRGQAAN